MTLLIQCRTDTRTLRHIAAHIRIKPVVRYTCPSKTMSLLSGSGWLSLRWFRPDHYDEPYARTMHPYTGNKRFAR